MVEQLKHCRLYQEHLENYEPMHMQYMAVCLLAGTCCLYITALIEYIWLTNNPKLPHIVRKITSEL